MYAFYPLMTTAECPNLLTSLWRFGFGNVFHSSQAGNGKWKLKKNTIKQLLAKLKVHYLTTENFSLIFHDLQFSIVAQLASFFK